MQQISKELSTQKKNELQIVGELKDILSQKFNFCLEDFNSNTRGKKEKSLARAVGIYILHTICQFNTEKSTRYFLRDKTMCNYSCMKIENMRDDYNFDDELMKIESIIQEKWDNLK